MASKRAPQDTVETYTRRRFLKGTGMGLACLPLATVASARGRSDDAEAQARVLDGAETRIEQHRKSDARLRLVGPDGRSISPGTPVQIELQRHEFLFGCNIFKLFRCRTPADNAGYEEHFASLLNFATLPFYWWTYERRPGQREDERTEGIVQWCKTHGITTKGHPLAWNWAEQTWLPEEPKMAMEAQLKRIARCVERFKGDIDTWDVVNEATHYDRPECKSRAPKLTEAISEMGVGNYVRSAFQAARKANPQATLLINDYRTDAAYEKNVISELVGADGQALYDVVGIQSHMHGRYWGARQAWDVCERFAKFGKPLHFTETTVVSGPRDGNKWVTTAEGEERQAEHVAQFYKVLFSHPAVEAITWWDFTDQNAWQGAPAGLVRADMSPKPAYTELKRLVKEAWWTRLQEESQPEGAVRFRGYRGQYQVTAAVDGRRLTGRFVLGKGPSAAVDVRLA